MATEQEVSRQKSTIRAQRAVIILSVIAEFILAGLLIDSGIELREARSGLNRVLIAPLHSQRAPDSVLTNATFQAWDKP